MISMQIKGMDKVVKRLMFAPQKLSRIIKNTIREGVGIALNESKKIITRGGYGSKRALDTGQMRSNMGMKVEGDKGIVHSSPVTDYSVYVHEGTRKMRARPFLTATGKKLTVEKTLENILKKHVDREI